MTATNIFFHSNIRFLRERKKVTQEKIAEDLDFTRIKLQALESGKTKNPVLEDIVKFSEYFRVSTDALLKVNLAKLGELKLRELLTGNDTYVTGSNLRVLAITVDRDNKENAEYVPRKAKAGYLAGYNDPEYIASLDRLVLPNLPKHGTYRVFGTMGDSMLPIPENSDVIAQYVQDWKSLKADTPCIVILKADQDFVFKLVTVQKDGNLLLKSLNQNYQPYTVQGSDVLEIWKYYKHQTATLPEAETDLQQLKTMILDLKSSLHGKK